jgi:O-antigen/teichoic acid export membrane protein
VSEGVRAGGGPDIFARLARGAGVTFVILAGSAGLGFIGQALMARWLGAAGYGLVTHVVNWAEIVALLAGMGLSAGCVRYVPQYGATGHPALARGFVRFAYAVTAATGILGALLLMAPGGIGAVWSGHEREWRLGAWLVPVLAFTLLQMQVARAQGRLVLAYGPRNILKNLAFLVAGYAVWRIAGGLSVAMALALSIGSSVLVIAVQAIGLRGWSSQHQPAPRGEWPVGEWMRVSTSLLFGSVFLLMLSRTDVLMLGIFVEAGELGVYNAAMKTAGLTAFVLVAINSAVGPQISAMHARGDREGLQDLVARFSLWTFWLTLAVAIGLAVLGRFVLGLFGPEFIAGYAVLLVLLAGHITAAAMGLVGNLLSLTGHQNDALRVYGIALVGNVCLNLLLIPRFGTAGAAFVTAISAVAVNCVLYRLVLRRLWINPSIFRDRKLRS